MDPSGAASMSEHMPSKSRPTVSGLKYLHIPQGHSQLAKVVCQWTCYAQSECLSKESRQLPIFPGAHAGRKLLYSTLEMPAWFNFQQTDQACQHMD